MPLGHLCKKLIQHNFVKVWHEPVGGVANSAQLGLGLRNQHFTKTPVLGWVCNPAHSSCGYLNADSH